MLLQDFLTTRQPGLLGLSALLMGFACWSRSETILLVIAGVLMILAAHTRISERRVHGKAFAGDAWRFLLAPVVLFLLWHLVHMMLVFPDAPRMSAIASGSEERNLITTIGGITSLVVAHDLYGTLIYLFVGAALINALAFRDSGGRILLAWIGILLIGFVAVVQILPAAYVESTVKRGFFKLFPIMVAFMGESRLFAFLSEKLRRWESGAGPNLLS
jgi:hypothetical protein